LKVYDLAIRMKEWEGKGKLIARRGIEREV
jgi:hypothetical protein